MTNIKGDGNNNFLTGTSGNDSIEGLGGNDTIFASSRNDTLNGGDGFDTADYASENDKITLAPQGIITKGGGKGKDRLVKVERIVAPLGKINVIDLTSASLGLSITTDLASNKSIVNGVPGIGNITTTIENFVNVNGSPNNDIIIGNNSNNLLKGSNGNDSIASGAGDDTLESGTGDDTLLGESGNDVFIGSSGNDILKGGNNNDLVDYGDLTEPIILKAKGIVEKGSLGNDLLFQVKNIKAPIDQLNGIDASDATATTPINISLSTNSLKIRNVPFPGKIASFNVFNFTDVIGTPGDDKIEGNTQNNSLVGFTGNDTISGLIGDDIITGQLGNDDLAGGEGQDVISGSENDDTLSGDKGNDTLSGGEGNDILGGGDDDDIMFGSNGDDTMFGGNGDDSMSGASGNDSMSGASGNDSIEGNSGNDSIDGSPGNDTLRGFGGLNDKDVLTGGPGNDKFLLGTSQSLFYSNDGINGYAVIKDLSLGDTIQLKSTPNYQLIQTADFVGSAAKDTAIALGNGDIIGIIQDNTSLITSINNNSFLSFV